MQTSLVHPGPLIYLPPFGFLASGPSFLPDSVGNNPDLASTCSRYEFSDILLIGGAPEELRLEFVEGLFLLLGKIAHDVTSLTLADRDPGVREDRDGASDDVGCFRGRQRLPTHSRPVGQTGRHR